MTTKMLYDGRVYDVMAEPPAHMAMSVHEEEKCIFDLLSGERLELFQAGIAPYENLIIRFKVTRKWGYNTTLGVHHYHHPFNWFIVKQDGVVLGHYHSTREPAYSSFRLSEEHNITVAVERTKKLLALID